MDRKKRPILNDCNQICACRIATEINRDSRICRSALLFDDLLGCIVHRNPVCRGVTDRDLNVKLVARIVHAHCFRSKCLSIDTELLFGNRLTACNRDGGRRRSRHANSCNGDHPAYNDDKQDM